MNYLVNPPKWYADQQLTIEQNKIEIMNLRVLIETLNKKLSDTIVDLNALKISQALQDEEIVKIKELLQDLEDNKVDKEDDKEIVKVDDLENGDPGAVATIGDIRKALKVITDATYTTGEKIGKDLKTCWLKPEPQEILEFSLNKGVYILDADIYHVGTKETTGEVWFEVNGAFDHKAIITGEGYTHIGDLIKVVNDNTTITLYARRVNGLNLEIVSSDFAKSYARWIQVAKG